MTDCCANCSQWRAVEDGIGECWSSDSGREPPNFATRAKDVCEAWQPSTYPWRLYGELRKPINAKFLRYSAVRSMFEAGKINMETAVLLLSQKHTRAEMAVILTAIETCWSKSYAPSRILSALTHKVATAALPASCVRGSQ